VAQHKAASKSNGKRRVTKKSMKKSAASRGGKSSDVKQNDQASGRSAGDQEVTIDRRRKDRRQEDRESAAEGPADSPKLQRREKVNRRRQIDPTTCERDYTENEVEFMNALDEYKRKSGRMFPTCSEVLEVVRSLGYVKVGSSQPISCSAEPFVSMPEAQPASAPELGSGIE
jgi:hypothetical protein